MKHNYTSSFRRDGEATNGGGIPIKSAKETLSKNIQACIPMIEEITDEGVVPICIIGFRPDEMAGGVYTFFSTISDGEETELSLIAMCKNFVEKTQPRFNELAAKYSSNSEPTVQERDARKADSGAESQKQILIDIMDEDQKDGLYDDIKEWIDEGAILYADSKKGQSLSFISIYESGANAVLSKLMPEIERLKKHSNK